MKKVLLLIIGVFFLTACSGGNNKVTIYTPDTNNQAPTVTYEKAKELIDNGAILIDVRTIEEYNEKHIDGSILLPLDSINEQTTKDKILTKETTVLTIWNGVHKKITSTIQNTKCADNIIALQIQGIDT